MDLVTGEFRAHVDESGTQLPPTDFPERCRDSRRSCLPRSVPLDGEMIDLGVGQSDFDSAVDDADGGRGDGHTVEDGVAFAGEVEGVGRVESVRDEGGFERDEGFLGMERVEDGRGDIEGELAQQGRELPR